MSEKWLNSPAYVSTSKININGRPGQRLMVVYRTVGCEYDKNSKGCTMCDFAFYSDPDINDDNIKIQHKETVDILDGMDFIQFDLLTLGNFYNDREITPELRKYLLESLSNFTNVKRVLTESKRGYVNEKNLYEARKYLRNDQILEYALGYESSDEYIRNVVLNKGVPERHLNESLQMCKDTDTDFASYVLIKPHTLTEARSIDDAVDTAIHVLEKADKYGVNARIAFEPVFVTKGKVLEELWKKGEYMPPKLWSVAEVLVKTAEKMGVVNTDGKLFVGLSDENLSEGRLASNYCVCDHEIKSAIQAYNGHQNTSRLKDLYHDCKDEWKRDIEYQTLHQYGSAQV